MSATLIPVGELTKTVGAVYRAHFIDFLRLLVWLIVPVVLRALLPLFPLSKLAVDTLGTALNGIAGIISLWLSVVLVDLIRGYFGDKPDTKKLARASWGLVGRIVDFALVSLLQGIVVGFWFFPLILPRLALQFRIAGLNQILSPEILGIVVLFGIVFLVPGIIFWNWFSFARYTVLIDGTPPGSAALRASRALVRDRGRQVAWRWIGSYLYFGSFIFLGTVALLGVIGALTGNPRAAFEAGAPVWWSVLVVNLVTTLVTPLFISIGVKLYEDAKRSRS